MPFANDCLDQIGVCPNRLYTLLSSQGIEDELRIQLIDPLTGALIDLTQYGIGSNNEGSSLSSSSSPYPADFTGLEVIVRSRYEDVCPAFKAYGFVKSETDAQNGIIYFNVTPHDTRHAGIFVSTVNVVQNGTTRKVFPFYLALEINPGVFNPTAPLSMAEVRLAVRDVCPEMNFLIDTVEFKDEEIAWALRRPIDYWNEAQPPLNVIYSPQTFPFRYNWMEATISMLLRTVAVWLRRNDLDYSAGGLTVADTKKWPEYQRMATERWQEYKEWVKNKKIELNVASGFSSIGGYRYNPYR